MKFFDLFLGPSNVSKLLLNDMTLTIALCDACPSTEVDELTISLLNIFDSRGLGFVLLQALIEHEVDQTGTFLIEPHELPQLIAFFIKKMRQSFSDGTVSRPKCSQSMQNGRAQTI